MNKILLLVSLILDCMFILMYIYIPYELEVYKFMFILVISFLPFIGREFTKTIVCVLIYLMLNFTLGGISSILYGIVNNFYIVSAGLILIFIVLIIIRCIKKINNKKVLFYDILIEHNNECIFLSAYCDTGNMLLIDYNIPVVFLKNIYLIGKYYKSIEVNTVNLKSNIDVYYVDSFKIKINDKYVKKRVYLAYADISYDAIFGLNILGG